MGISRCTQFIIDNMKKLRLTMTYPMTVGRNFAEILRVIDALQTTDSQEVACPADWEPGKPVIIRPSVSDEDAKAKFPQGLQYEIGYDTTPFIEQSVEEVFKTLRDAIILVAIAVFRSVAGVVVSCSAILIGVVALFGAADDVGRYASAAYLVVFANLVGASVETVMLPVYRRLHEDPAAPPLLRPAPAAYG